MRDGAVSLGGRRAAIAGFSCEFQVRVRAGAIEYGREIISTFSGLRLRAASRSLVGQVVRLGHEERFQ
jgi:hypothetical protein